MGWETRQRGGRYYTRSRRVGGRVVREYLGVGDAADTAAALDTAERTERARRMEASRRDCECLDEVDRIVGELCGLAELAARAMLTAAGYRQHKRGEWRRRREAKHSRGTA